MRRKILFLECRKKWCRREIHLSGHINTNTNSLFAHQNPKNIKTGKMSEFSSSCIFAASPGYQCIYRMVACTVAKLLENLLRRCEYLDAVWDMLKD